MPNKKVLDVGTYLATTRFVDSDAILPEIYNHIHFFVKKLLIEAKIDENVYLTHSSALRCEILEIKDKRYIVYDQNLGQVSNFLNRILFESSNQDDALKYTMNVSAQILGNYDCLIPEALFLADHYNKDIPDIPYSEASITRGYFTTVQELYIIVHEIMHEIYRRASNKIIAVVGEDIKMYCEMYVDRRNTDTRVKNKEYMEKLHQTFPDAFVGLTLEESLRSVTTEFSEELNRRALNSKNLHEEMFCDYMAAFWTLICYPDESFDTISAIYVGHYNLRVINSIQKSIAIYADFVDRSEIVSNRFFEIDTVLRSHYLLERLPMMYSAVLLLRKHLKNVKPTLENLYNLFQTYLIVETNISVYQLGGKPSEEVNIEDIQNTRQRLISLQAVYYRKVYDKANLFITKSFLHNDIMDFLQDKYSKEGTTLEKVRRSCLDPIVGEELRKVLRYMITSKSKLQDIS